MAHRDNLVAQIHLNNITTMTTPGPTLIKKCNRCDGLMRQRTIASGNNFGARYWTDGKVDAPMLPDTPLVVVCPHCQKVDWLKNLVEVGEIPGPRGFGVPLPEYDLSFDDLPFFDAPTGDDYLGFLESTELIHDQEFYLRWMYWHLMNDARRKSSALLPLGIDEVENLQRLLELLKSPSESIRLTIAEIYRELGDFESCEKMLDYDFSDEFIPLAQTIYLLQEEKNPCVDVIFDSEIFFDAWKYRRNPPIYTPEPEAPFDPSGPPVFEIKSREWWIKVLGMLQHNWALIEEEADGSATVYFLHDCGLNMARNGYSLKQLKGRSAIVDSLDFESVQLAKEALARNEFWIHEEGGLLGSDMKPVGFFYDVRVFEEGVYSRRNNWI